MKTKYYLFLIILCIASFAGSAIRMVQFLYAIDSTGFYKSNSLSVLTLNIVLIVVYAFFLIGFFFLKKEEFMNDNPLYYKEGSFSNFSLSVLFVFLLSHMVITSFDMLNEIKNLNYLKIIEYIFLILLIIFIFNLIFNKQKITEKPYFEFLAITPLCWNLLRFISLFIKHTGIANISAMLFEIIMLAFFVLFFLSYSKVLTKRGGNKSMFVFGICAIFSTALSVLPQLLLNIKPTKDNTFIFLANNLLEISIALFIANIVFTNNTPQEEELEEYNEFDEIEQDIIE